MLIKCSFGYPVWSIPLEMLLKHILCSEVAKTDKKKKKKKKLRRSTIYIKPGLALVHQAMPQL